MYRYIIYKKESKNVLERAYSFSLMYIKRKVLSGTRVMMMALKRCVFRA